MADMEVVEITSDNSVGDSGLNYPSDNYSSDDEFNSR